MSVFGVDWGGQGGALILTFPDTALIFFCSLQQGRGNGASSPRESIPPLRFGNGRCRPRVHNQTDNVRRMHPKNP